jgi:hypothetical protein
LRGFGYGRFGHEGFGHFDYGGWYRGGGYGGGWHGGGDDFWILGDLFGLALDFGSLALSPWGFLGWNLLDTGIQAVSSLDTGGGYQQSGYNPPLCGSYYSDENPGCWQ